MIGNISVMPVLGDLEEIEVPVLENYNWEIIKEREENQGYTALEGYIKIIDRVGNIAYSSGWHSNEYLALYIYDGTGWWPYWYPFKYLPFELVCYLELEG